MWVITWLVRTLWVCYRIGLCFFASSFAIQVAKSNRRVTIRRWLTHLGWQKQMLTGPTQMFKISLNVEYLWLKWWNVMFKDCLLWSIMDHPVKISPVRRQWERLGDDKFVQIVRLSGIVPRSDQIPHKCWKYFVFFRKWNVIVRIVKSSG